MRLWGRRLFALANKVFALCCDAKDATRNLPGVRTLKVPLFKGLSRFSRCRGDVGPWYTVSLGPPTAESLHLRATALIHDARYRLRPIQLCRYYTRHMDRASPKNSNGQDSHL